MGPVDAGNAPGSETHRRYQPADLPGDLFAGLTLWAVFSAQALAYSRLAHATPVAGLVTAVVGAIVYAALGSSPRISIGPAGGICAIVGAAVATIPPERLAASIAALTLMAGAFLVLAGLLRITFLQRLFPAPVFVGYLAGTGITILIGQGRELVSGGSLALWIGLASIAAVLALKRLAPRVPAPFVVLFVATVASAVLGLAERGVPVIGGALGRFGELVWPGALGWEVYRAMLIPALGLGLFVYVDALANAEALAQASDPPIQARREYFALGTVNVAAGLWGGFVAGTSTSRSVVGMRAGARTRLAPALAGVLLFLTALSVVRLIEPMPLAALAGVVFVAAFDLIDVRRLREFGRLRRADLVIATGALAGVVLVGPMWGVGIGVLAALAEALRRAMEPERSVLAPTGDDRYYVTFDPASLPVTDGFVIYRFGASLFFGNADVFLDDMRRVARLAAPSLRTVVVNADALGVPDATARDALQKSRDALERRGIRLVFGNARGPLRKALTRAGSFTLMSEPEFLAHLAKVGAVRHQRSSL